MASDRAPTSPQDAHPAYKAQIARRMFVATADNNYILARIAWFNELDWDFFWLGLHAVEKYLKATLLMNDRSAKGGHDLLTLYRRTLEIDDRLALPELVAPGIENVFWPKQTMMSFLEKLNDYGSADNRYNLTGYAIRPDHLFSLDQLIWAVRRRCRRLNTTIAITADRRIPWDHLYALDNNPREWSVGTDMPIERLMGGDLDDPERQAFTNLNVPFAPEQPHTMTSWSSRANNPPLSDWYRLLTSDTATAETREQARTVLAWARDNIKLGKQDTKVINAAIADFERRHLLDG